jgi:hypothetical protein
MAARNEESMAFDRVNYRLLLIGIGIVILGYVLMSGGGSGDPNMFDATEVFSTRRITVAPWSASSATCSWHTPSCAKAVRSSDHPLASRSIRPVTSPTARCAGRIPIE